MANENVYVALADHLSNLGMGYPPTETLVEILKENFSPIEAQVALAIPTRVIPLKSFPVDKILENIDLDRKEVVEILNDLSRRGLLFSSTTQEGEKGYALQQVGFSFPQTFFWKGEDTPHSRNMASLVAKYFNRKVTREAYGSKTKAYRYVPLFGTIETGVQSVYPHHTMEMVIDKATDFAVCHCSCRMLASLRGRPCDHPTEVCIKFDEVAQYVVARDLGRKISRDEAGSIVRKSEEEGLVHFVDNTEEDIKHNCNCCGCACWNVG